jgi:uncharacterized protein (TIGR02444 family)
MSIEFEDHPFWDYACAVYGREGVSPALIAMQDRHGLDVNILLLCLWVSHSGRGVLADGELDHVLAVSSSWNPEIVCGLRQLRVRLRDGVTNVPRTLSDAIRQRILDIEIDSEHVEQLALVAGLAGHEDTTRPVEQRFGDCLANLSLYFDRRGLVPAAADRDDLTTVLAAAFPGIGEEEIRSRCAAHFGSADRD